MSWVSMPLDSCDGTAVARRKAKIEIPIAKAEETFSSGGSPPGIHAAAKGGKHTARLRPQSVPGAYKGEVED